MATNKVIKVFLISSSILVLAAGCNNKSTATPASPTPTYNYTHQLEIGGQTLMVEIATSSEAMQQGLSDRTSMASNQGMLFDFTAASSTQEVEPAFWMKDMDFSLDFIWINQNKIIGITPDAPSPDTKQESQIENLQTYYPPSPVNEVLEVNAGWSKKNNIAVGDEVKLVTNP